MTTSTHESADLFTRATTAVAILGPILLVMVAGTLPDDLARGHLIVYGEWGIVVALGAAIVLHAMYRLGFSKALTHAPAKPNHSVTK